jgi:hypothetical protein
MVFPPGGFIDLCSPSPIAEEIDSIQKAAAPLVYIVELITSLQNISATILDFIADNRASTANIS